MPFSVTLFPAPPSQDRSHASSRDHSAVSDSRAAIVGSDLAAGLTLFAIGLFKKMVIADSVAQFVATASSMPPQPDSRRHSWKPGWRRRSPIRLQIYFDFSGYSDMAVALGAHVRLPSFRSTSHSPYKAASIIDFWRRWHITLSRFLRDYLYIPLGGNRKGRVRGATST